MKKLVLASAFLALPFLNGCHLDEAKKEYGTGEQLDRLERSVGQLVATLPRALAGDPSAMVPAARSGWNIVEWLGGFVFTAVAGAAAGHVSGRRVERKRRKVHDDSRQLGQP